MISSVVSVLSCYIICIANIFHNNGMYHKTHGKGSFINSNSHRHLSPLNHLQPWRYIYQYDKERGNKCTRLRSYFNSEIFKIKSVV